MDSIVLDQSQSKLVALKNDKNIEGTSVGEERGFGSSFASTHIVEHTKKLN